MMKYPAIIRVVGAFLLGVGMFCTHSVSAQTGPASNESGAKVYAPVLTGAPILSITPDARVAGMGGTGVVSGGDAFALYHNLSLLPRVDKTWGVSIGYTPWMPDVSKDMSLSSIYGYYRWNGSADRRFAVAGSVRYFSVGEAIAFPPGAMDAPAVIHPYELAANVGFAVGFSPHWGVGLSLGYLHSDYNYSLDGMRGTSGTMLFDISGSYHSPSISLGSDTEGIIKVGLAVNNIGGKLSYDGGATKQFLPTILRLGEGIEINLPREGQELGIYLEQSKLLAPTMPVITKEMTLEEAEQVQKAYQDKSAFSAIFSSWGDAPGGFVEELKEVVVAVGAEYRYRSDFDLAVRMGYQHQHEDKGSGAGLTFGAGLGYQKAKLNISYFVANKSKSPLNNTFRISLGIDF